MKAPGGKRGERRCEVGRAVWLEGEPDPSLGVIGEAIDGDALRSSGRWELADVDGEQCATEDRALGDIKSDIGGVRQGTADRDGLSSASKIGREPAEHRAREATVVVESVKQEVVVDRVEGG